MNIAEKSQPLRADEGEEEELEDVPSRNFELFLELKDLVSVLNSTNIDVLSQGLARLRSQLHAATTTRSDPSSNNARVLFEYMHSSPECTELFRLWEFQVANNITQLESLVPDILAKTIQLAHTPSARSVGLSIIRRVLRGHMKIVYRNLSSGRIPLCQSALRLLIAMNSFSQPTTREMIEGFNFQQKAVGKFLVLRKKHSDEGALNFKSDIRSLWIRFVLSFFVNGDARIKKDVLDIKKFVSAIFKGLGQDSYELIGEVLSVMYDYLIMEQEVSRSLKVALFNNYVLDQLTKIYIRKDSDSSTDPTKIPADLVHHFLISICCTPGVGVCFHDASWYPPSTIAQPSAAGGGDGGDKNVKIHNKILSKYVISLRPTDDPRQQELLLKILRACPELVQVYWQSTSLTFDPRLSSKWLANMTLLHKIISLPIPSLYFPLTQSYPTMPPPVHVIMDNILPTCANRSVTGKGLQHASPLVKYMTTVILGIAFQKLGRVLEKMDEIAAELDELQDERAFPQTDVTADETVGAQLVGSARWRQVAQHIHDEMRRRVPDVQTIVLLQHQVASISKMAQTQQEDATELRVQQQVLHESTLRLIKYYQQYLPEAMMESKFDFGKLIPVDLGAVQLGPLIHLLELLLVLPDFKWASKAADSSTSHLTTLLTLYLSTNHTHVRHLVQRILHKLLSESILFQHDANEVRFWLEALPRNFLLSGVAGSDTAGVLSEDQKTVLQFMDDCIGRCLKTPYRYVDDVVNLVTAVNQRLQTEQDPTNNVDVGGRPFIAQKLRSITVDILAAQGLSSFTHPYSPLLATLLEQYLYVREQKPTFVTPIALFLSRLMKRLMRKQTVPFYLEESLRKVMDVIEMDGVDEELMKNTGKWDEKCIFAALGSDFENFMIAVDASYAARKINGKVGNGLTKSKTGAKRKDSVEEETLALLKNKNPSHLQTGRSNFIALLLRMPVSSIDKYLADLANHCEQNLAWSNYEPILEYLEMRHPSAGSLFAYTEVTRYIHGYGNENPVSSIGTLLLHIPFATLFLNVTHVLLESSKIVETLQQSINQLPVEEISPACHLIILFLSALLARSSQHSIEMATLQTCCILLKDLLARSQGNETVFNELKDVVFGHPVVKGLFLVGKGTEDYDMIASLFSQFLSFCDEEDLSSILDQLLCLDYDWLFSSTSQVTADVKRFNGILSEVLSKLSKITSSRSTVSAGSLKILIRLWQSHPCAEFDTLIAEFLEVSLPPHILGHTGRRNSAAPAIDFPLAEQRLFGILPGGIEPMIVTFILEHINETRAKILALLIVGDPQYRAEFVRWVLGNKNNNKKVKLPEMVVLMNAFSKAVSTVSSDNNLIWMRNATKDDKRLAAYLVEHYGRTLLYAIFTSPSSSKHHDVSLETATLTRLVELSPSVEFPLFVLEIVKQHTASLVTLESLLVMETALRITVREETRNKLLETYLEEFLKDVAALVKTNGFLGSSADVDIVFQKLASIATASLNNFSGLSDDTVRDFIFAILLDRFSESVMIDFVATLISLVYKKHQKDEPIQTYLRMTIEHKDFERLTAPPTLSQKSFMPTTESKHRLALTNLVHTLVRIRPSVATKHPSHIDALLSSYSATTSLSDQLILDVLITVERRSRNSIVAKAMVWGQGSNTIRGHNAQRGGVISSGAGAIAESLALLDPLVMTYSYTRFPVTKALRGEEKEKREKEFAAPTYDPAFLLPLFSSLMTYGNQLDCRKFIETNALGFVVTAMSSLDEDVRRVAYFLMDEFYILLEHATFREKKQILLLLDSLKNAITDCGDHLDPMTQRIPTIITVFVAHAFAILLQPAHFMYPHVNRFLLQRPFIDLEDIPMFYSLFNTSSFNFKKDRVWMLRLISAGLKCPEDYKLLKRRHVWDIISSFYNSQMADGITRKIVVEILFNAIAIPTITVELLTHSGLATFLHHIAVTTTHLNHILFTARLLLRTILSAHVRHDRLRWVGLAFFQQSASVATALLHAIEKLTVSKVDVPVVLATVLDVLKTFHYIALVRVAGNPGAPTGTSAFTPHYARKIIGVLRKCEPHLDTVPVGQVTSARYSIPTGMDELDSLYELPSAPTAGILMELLVQGDGFVSDRSGSFEMVAARVLALGVEDRVGRWVAECLGGMR
ncbi:ribosome 60S biogenesis N-terminal-domain-containing protein [Jimgerdemannia flammicorona]|uniref:Ribosome 60S biogenesis N-terminal-domain-containing protein n=1 Tax=Jimgerdemannia flammicorona TaxID=994334 RepID=A0A433D5G4_9FUNG|nr:ribosome 60S biogenesis N-terminal-domain-containing protein [Jimgerdemannia flammicorona]